MASRRRPRSFLYESVWTVLMVGLALISIPSILTPEATRAWALFWGGLWVSALLASEIVERWKQRHNKQPGVKDEREGHRAG